MNTKASHMRFRSRAKETGQALVLIALLMVILLGMLGLAIDGGGMFLLWRDAQNAVDAAALQAAFAYCTNGEDLASAQDAGLIATEMNGFDDSGLTLGDNEVTVDRATAIVAPELLPGNAAVKNDIILVRIVAEKPSYFIQLIYGGPLRITVTALGVCNAGGDSFFDGYGVFSMGNCSNNVIESDFTGSSAHFFADIGSNGDLRANGSQDGIIFHTHNGDEAEVYFVDNIDDLAKFDTYPTSGGTVPGSDDDQELKSYEEFPVLYTWAQFQPGGEIWDAIDELNGTTGDWATDPNLHYVNGDTEFDSEYEGLWVVNGDITYKSGFLIGDMGLTAVASGQIASQGNINNKNSPNLWKPYSNSTGLTNALLFFSAYAPNGNPPTSCAKGNGNGAMKFTGSGIIGMGLIYAPYAGIEWSASDAYWCGSIISLTVDSSGSDKWFFTTDMPSDTALDNAGAADWFLNTNYLLEGQSCDFFPESEAEIFLGDLSG